MAIHVTPIPKTVSLTTPSFTLGSANAAGAALTAVASNSTLLTFDAVLPDAITFGQSGAAGSATVTSRRDHAHAMAATPVSDISCSVYNDAAITLSNDTATAVAMNTEVYDTDTMHDTSTNNSRVIFKTAGKYIVTQNLVYAHNTTGYRSIELRLNGSTQLNKTTYADFRTGDDWYAMTTVVDADADDYVETLAYQNSGGDLALQTYGTYSPGMIAIKVIG